MIRLGFICGYGLVKIKQGNNNAQTPGREKGSVNKLEIRQIVMPVIYMTISLSCIGGDNAGFHAKW